MSVARDRVSEVEGMSDSALLVEFVEIVRRGRRAEARLLSLLCEVDRRKLWAAEACSSMFAFCVERLHMSESEAGKRVYAARTAGRFPVLFEMIAAGAIHKTGIIRLGRYLTEENHRDLLARARHRTVAEIDVLIAEIAPRPDVPSRIRKLPSPRPAHGEHPDLARAPATSSSTPSSANPSSANPSSASRSSTSAASARAGSAGTVEAPPPWPALPSNATANVREAAPSRAEKRRPQKGSVAPLSPARYELQVTLDEEARAVLRQLQDLYGPGVDVARIVTEALELLRKKKLTRKAGVTDRPRRSRPQKKSAAPTRSRHVPAAVKRAVWRRDDGRCTFVSASGSRCKETRGLEYAHDVPDARGGEPTEDNLRLRCRAHNQYEADLDFGRAFMDAKRRHATPAASG